MSNLIQSSELQSAVKGVLKPKEPDTQEEKRESFIKAIQKNFTPIKKFLTYLTLWATGQGCRYTKAVTDHESNKAVKTLTEAQEIYSKAKKNVSDIEVNQATINKIIEDAYKTKEEAFKIHQEALEIKHNNFSKKLDQLQTIFIMKEPLQSIALALFIEELSNESDEVSKQIKVIIDTYRYMHNIKGLNFTPTDNSLVVKTGKKIGAPFNTIIVNKDDEIGLALQKEISDRLTSNLAIETPSVNQIDIKTKQGDDIKLIDIEFEVPKLPEDTSNEDGKAPDKEEDKRST